MPNFVITDKKSGKKYKVTGPSKERALEVFNQKRGAVEFASKPSKAKVNPDTMQPEGVPEFKPVGVDGYDPKTGEVHDNSIGAKVASFATGVAEGVPVIGRALRAAGDAEIAAIATPFNGKSFGDNYQAASRFGNEAQADNPNTAVAGNITGAVVPMVALGGTPGGASALGMGAEGLGVRTALSGGSNALISGADTLARGGSLGDAAKDALVSGGIGSVLPGAGKFLGSVGKGVYDAVAPRLRAITQPAQEAERRAGVMLNIDRAAGPTLGAADEASAAINGQNLLNVDRGGMSTRSLVRSATNQDPEAHGMVKGVVDSRFESQASRAESFIDRISRGKASSDTARQELKTAAPLINRPAYKQAYKDGADLVKTPELERLMGSPAVVTAMKNAIQTGKDRAIKEGMGAFNPAISITDDGRILFNKVNKAGGTTFPDLQFWDYTKRELDDMAKAAARSGRTGEADTLSGLSQTLRNELDSVVPSYKNARAGAQSFFEADSALEAGEQFVTKSLNLDEASRVIGAMKPHEKQAFAVGFASKLKDLIHNSGDRRNVIDKIFGSPAARDKIQIALGPKHYQEFEQFVKVESAMDELRKSMGGSDTARKWAELALAGGGAAGAGLGVGMFTGDWKSGLAASIVAGATRRFNRGIDAKMTKQIAKLLLSDDPTALNRAATMAAANPKASAAVEAVQTVIGSIARGAMLPSIPLRQHAN